MQFSIVTPTFNVAHSLEATLRSVQSQTGVTHEHIIVDGGSTDGTLDLLQQHGSVDWVSEPDQGIYDALNKGIRRARGEWLHFLGADDALAAPDVLQGVAAAIQPGDRVVYGDVVSEVFGGRYGGAWDQRRILDTNICHQAIFFHREVFETVGDFDLRYPWLSDWDHNLKWLFHPDLPSRHIDLVVAEFGHTGISSLNRDDAFYRDRRYNYLRYGHQALPRGRALWLLAREVLKSVRLAAFGRIPECGRMGWNVVTRRGNGQP